MLTQAQFNQFWIEFSRSFPAAADYVNKLAAPREYLQAICKSLEAFDHQTLRECLEYMLSGRLEPIPNTQLGQIGHELRLRCREVNEIHRRQSAQDWQKTAEEDGPRYVCPTCYDTGYVAVVGPQALEKLWHQQPVVLQPVAMACHCQRGESASKGHKDNTSRPIGRYYRGCEDKHMIIRFDGPGGVLYRAHELLPQHDDWTECKVEAARQLMQERHTKLQASRKGHQEFLDYA